MYVLRIVKKCPGQKEQFIHQGTYKYVSREEVFNDFVVYMRSYALGHPMDEEVEKALEPIFSQLALREDVGIFKQPIIHNLEEELILQDKFHNIGWKGANALKTLGYEVSALEI